MIRIYRYGEVSAAQIFARAQMGDNVSETVRQIIEEVRARGDAALLEYTRRFDGVDLSSLRVDETEIMAGWGSDRHSRKFWNRRQKTFVRFMKSKFETVLSLRTNPVL